MYASRLRAAGLAVVATLGLSACASYGGLGYGGVSVGVGSGGYYDPYYGGYGAYGGYGYGYDGYGYGGGYGGYYPSYGWYDNFYYPGSGIYIYSRNGTRHRWSDSQRRYWESRRDRRRDGRDGRWDGHRRDRQVTQVTTERATSGERDARRQTYRQPRTTQRSATQDQRRSNHERRSKD